MSRQSLKGFLEQLDKELKGSSGPYRKEADKREMNFIFNKTSFITELKKEFEFRGLTDIFQQKDVQSFMERGATTILENCRTQAQTFKSGRGVVIKSNQHFIRVTLNVERNPRTDKNYSNFTKLKTLYRDAVDTFVLQLNTFIKESYNEKLTKTRRKFNRETYKSTLIETDNEITRGSDLIEGSHAKGEGILETRVRDAIDTAINKKYKSKIDRESVISNLDLLGIKLEFIRDDTTDTHTITAGSRVENQQTGITSLEDKIRFRKQLKEAIERLDGKTPISGLKGSDSIEVLKAKQAAFLILNSFARKKNVTAIGQTKSPKKQKRKGELKAKNKQSRVVESALPRVAKPRVKKARSKSTKGVAASPLSLMVLINKELPDTVRKNMQLPGLENQTGRFAQSVRITDVTQTTKGFPSFGYTYQKRPYQVFEMGAGTPPWATPERDPRKLIDMSIREIAAQFALGRFYTRRV